MVWSLPLRTLLGDSQSGGGTTLGERPICTLNHHGVTRLSHLDLTLSFLPNFTSQFSCHPLQEALLTSPPGSPLLDTPPPLPFSLSWHFSQV